MQADKAMKEGKVVGISTMPVYSAYFGQILSLTYFDIVYSTPSTEVTVMWGNLGVPPKNVRAMVAPAPYKKDERRVDLTKV